MAVQKLILRRITLQDRSLTSLVESMKTRPYDLEEGRGFYVEEEETTWVRAFFVAKVSSRINRFIPEEMKVVQEQIESPVAVPFSIDTRTGTLDIQSTQRLSHRLIDELGVLTGFSCTIEDIRFDPLDVINAFKVVKWDPQVNRVKIKDFVHRDGIVGDVTFRVSGAGDGPRLVKEWAKAVQAITVILTPPQGPVVQVTINRGGTVSIAGDNLDYALLHEIKSALVAGG